MKVEPVAIDLFQNNIADHFNAHACINSAGAGGYRRLRHEGRARKRKYRRREVPFHQLLP